ncbi:MAG: hypothetical protein UU95_C0022G0007 [Parcubacteria group bacterium GW2011_GWC2_42_12]|nr:MAG: hypothetical protein UU95_C0022G0007 [Parcubacteria group bacterium GW2011_GWC2_42_12]
MRLNMKKFSLLSAAAAGAVYSACTLFVILWPGFSTKLMGWLFHLSSPEAVFGTMRVTATGYIGGLLEVVVYMYVMAWIFAWVFNRTVKHQ